MSDIELNQQLNEAAEQNDLEKVRQLLDEGANPNFIDVINLTAVGQAVRFQNAQMVQLLIDKGGDIHAGRLTPYYMTRLRVAEGYEEWEDYGSVLDIMDKVILEQEQQPTAHNLTGRLKGAIAEAYKWGERNKWPELGKYPQCDEIQSIGKKLDELGGHQLMLSAHDEIKSIDSTFGSMVERYWWENVHSDPEDDSTESIVDDPEEYDTQAHVVRKIADTYTQQQLEDATELDLSNCDFLVNLDELKGLKNLASLDLSQCEYLCNITALEEITSLTSINLSGCSNLPDNAVESLSKLSNLNSLNLSRCDDLTNISPLGKLTKLTHLDLHECFQLTDIIALEKLTRLTYLDLHDCIDIEDISALRGLTELTDLDLSSCIQITNIGVLSELTKLTSLKLIWCEGVKKSQITLLRKSLPATDISTSPSSERVRSSVPRRLIGIAVPIAIACAVLFSAVWVYDNWMYPIQEVLNASYDHGKYSDEISDMFTQRQLDNAITLELSHSDKLADISALKGATKMTEIELGHCPDLADLNGLEDLPNLTKLDLNSCDNRTTLKGLKKLPKLQVLCVSYCDALTDITALRETPGLTKLDLRGCTSLTNLKGLEGASKLTEIDLMDCQKLADIDALKELTDLTKINLWGV